MLRKLSVSLLFAVALANIAVITHRTFGSCPDTAASFILCPLTTGGLTPCSAFTPAPTTCNSSSGYHKESNYFGTVTSVGNQALVQPAITCWEKFTCIYSSALGCVDNVDILDNPAPYYSTKAC